MYIGKIEHTRVSYRNVYIALRVFKVAPRIYLIQEKTMPEKPINQEVQNVVEEAKQEVSASRQPWYHLSRIARILLIVYAVQLALFAVLAWWVHLYPVIPLDITITREFQENPSPWLNIVMTIIS